MTSTEPEEAAPRRRRHLGHGLLALAAAVLPRIPKWIMAGEGANKAWRTAGLVVLGIALVRAVAQRPVLAAPLAALVLVAAWRMRPTDAPEQPGGTGEEAKEHPAAGLSREQLADVLRGLLQERGGVHLTALAAALPGPRLTTRQVRDLLTREGIRVRDGVRVPGVGGREGVHRDDIPAPLSPTSGAPSGGVVVAGQSNNNNAGAGLEVERGEGMTIIRDLADRARRHRVARRT